MVALFNSMFLMVVLFNSMFLMVALNSLFLMATLFNYVLPQCPTYGQCGQPWLLRTQQPGDST